MAAEDLANRVAILEQKVEGLETLPARLESVEGRLTAVESQILQLRSEMRDGFSALRVEMRRLNDETSAQMRLLYEDLKDTIKRITLH